jgi:hypothetical protein
MNSPIILQTQYGEGVLQGTRPDGIVILTLRSASGNPYTG